jgi:hypothetical protein
MTTSDSPLDGQLAMTVGPAPEPQLGFEPVDARPRPGTTCGARAGTYCRRPSGHKAWSPHAGRVRDAEAEANRDGR